MKDSKEKNSVSLIDKLTEFEKKFCVDYENFPSPTNHPGIVTFYITFKDKFGSRLDNLGGITPRQLYNVAGKIRASKVRAEVSEQKAARKTAGKKPTKKAPEYTAQERLWLLAYSVPKSWSKKEGQKLAEAHKKEFPDLPSRSSEALVWKLMHLRGIWNPDKGGKKAKKQQKKAGKIVMTRKPVKNLGKIHRFTPEQETTLIERTPKRGKFRSGKLESLAKYFNRLYGTSLSSASLGVKCTRLRKKMLKSEREEKPAASLVSRIKTELYSANEKGDEFIVVDVAGQDKVIWKGDHEPKEITVFGGVSQNGTGKSNAECALNIDGTMLPEPFKDHLPEPVVYQKVSRKLSR